MEVEFPSSSDTSLEMPSIIEAISSSIDDSRFNFDELEQSTGETSTTTESDHMEVEANWSQSQDQYNQNYYQNYQHQQWNYQQGYSPYPQYGYMTPSPYDYNYMQSPPVEYHHNYSYNTNMMTNYEQQNHQQQQAYVFSGTQNTLTSPQDSQYSCNICVRTFKSSSNLTRHYMSKTHLKRLDSKKQNSKVTIIRTKKPRLGTAFTDISKDEKDFLWQLDDEIFNFLKVYEEEKLKNDGKNDQALPTPPLSPNSRAIANGHQNLAKSESVITIQSSSENMQGSPLSIRSSSADSVVKSPEMKDKVLNYENVTSNNVEFSSSSPKSINYTNPCIPTSSNINFDQTTSNSNNIISKNENSSDITSNDRNSGSEHQNNSISTNLTSNFSNLTNIAYDYENIESQNATDITLKNGNLMNITSNYEKINCTSSSANYYNNHNLESHGSIYQSEIPNSSTSNHITSINSMTSPRNAGITSDHVNQQHQTTNNAVQKDITSNSQVNITSNNEFGVNRSSNHTNLPNINSNYQTMMTKPTLMNLTSKVPKSLNQVQASVSRITTINPSSISKTTMSGLRIISNNQNVTSNNAACKTQTAYTLMASNSNIRYVNAANLIGNNVKIQQISPNGIKNFRIVNNSHQALQNKVKIPHSNFYVQQALPSGGQNSPNYGQSSPKFDHNSPKRVFDAQIVQNSSNSQHIVKNCEPSPKHNSDGSNLTQQYSPRTPNSPTVLIQQETGEKYEIIFSDENFGDNLS